MTAAKCADCGAETEPERRDGTGPLVIRHGGGCPEGIHYPRGAEWFGSETWMAHVDWHFQSPDLTCPGCVTAPLMREIRDRAWDGGERFDEVWACTDAYGEPGTIPHQGYDWSGIRDSSPGALRDMAEVLGIPAPTTA